MTAPTAVALWPTCSPTSWSWPRPTRRSARSCVVAPQAEAPQMKPSGHLVYVADDDVSTARLVEVNLSARGYRVRQFHRGAPVLRAFEEEHPDLMILDVMMPGINCFQPFNVD
ncbi:MAG: response regulator [Dehalococcoidia bacterium]|nr:response regulator [Dehalococcoidia bacterium]MSQ17567.1 response regulator [Dehalococcoidia bacterium]